MRNYEKSLIAHNELMKHVKAVLDIEKVAKGKETFEEIVVLMKKAYDNGDKLEPDERKRFNDLMNYLNEQGIPDWKVEVALPYYNGQKESS